MSRLGYLCLLLFGIGNVLFFILWRREKKKDRKENMTDVRMWQAVRESMTQIAASATLAKKYDTEPEKREYYLNHTLSAVKDCALCSNNAMELLALESGSFRLSEQEFDLRDMMSAITAFYYMQFKKKGLRFEYLVDKKAKEIMCGDPLRVSHVVTCLLGTSYEQTKRGGAVTVSLEEREAQFHMLVQSSSTIAWEEDPAWTVIKRITEAMGGRLTVTPSGEADCILPYGEMQTEYVQADPTHLAKVRVLVVEEDAVVGEYMEHVLSEIGIKGEMAVGADQALAMIQNTYAQGDGYDICFTEWKLSDGDGMQITEKIRQLYGNNTVVVLTSVTDMTSLQKGSGVMPDYFVAKPMFRSAIFTLLMSIRKDAYEQIHKREPSYDFKGKRILLAEDTAFSASLTRTLLASVHLEVEHVENGRDVVNMFCSRPAGTYAAILMDIMMPEVNGYEAAMQIRESAHPQAKEIPIYAMTSNNLAEDIEQAMQNGMNGHIAKPMDVDILYRMLWRGIFEL